jgi:hypothetical protein
MLQIGFIDNAKPGSLLSRGIKLSFTFRVNSSFRLCSMPSYAYRWHNLLLLTLIVQSWRAQELSCCTLGKVSQVDEEPRSLSGSRARSTRPSTIAAISFPRITAAFAVRLLLWEALAGRTR